MHGEGRCEFEKTHAPRQDPQGQSSIRLESQQQGEPRREKRWQQALETGGVRGGRRGEGFRRLSAVCRSPTRSGPSSDLPVLRSHLDQESIFDPPAHTAVEGGLEMVLPRRGDVRSP